MRDLSIKTCAAAGREREGRKGDAKAEGNRCGTEARGSCRRKAFQVNLQLRCCVEL